ncbi:MAG: (5-formylfuran-3-yl)methyl phosphate synthase [Pirellulaceae bacterium]
MTGPAGMTGLLVSVRSAAEAEVALAGGADLIDVKEPLRGSLGAADPQVWRDVRQCVAGRAPISAALGELAADFDAGLLPRTAGFQFAKMALAGCAARADWASAWLTAMANLPAGVAPVAVAYADWQAAAAPSPDEVLAAATRADCSLMLIDTWNKSRGNLLDHLSLAELTAHSKRAAGHGMRLVLAGSLDEAAIEMLLLLRPAFVGVRGAACQGGRERAIDLQRVKRLAQIVRGTAARRRGDLLDNAPSRWILPASGG